MPDQWWVDDDRLLHALGEALRAGDVPASFVETGKLAFPRQDLDAELAALTYDSAADSTLALAGTRADDLARLRQLTYRATRTGLEIELGVSEDAIVGQLWPRQAGTVEVSPARGDSTTRTINQAGGFVIRPIPATPFRLHCRTAADVSVVTEWVTLADPSR
ncbi:MAG TPA: hypothetical protein VG276_21455 [Actinomycetes bacterium]|jgi:hypothetical protein|nr:hypothetical protein [Actinomycetes bacterium]